MKSRMRRLAPSILVGSVMALQTYAATETWGALAAPTIGVAALSVAMTVGVLLATMWCS